MSIKLFFEAIIKVLLGFIIVAFLLFLPAWSFKYYEAWLFLELLFIPMIIVGFILMFKNPKLLKERLDNKENEKEQKLVVALSGLMFLIGFIVAGLNFRYKWIIMPKYTIILGSILFIISYIIYGEVLRENTYLARTIKVEKDQKVIDTGLYGIIRHPMYMATIVLFLSMPMILNSLITFIIFLIYPFLINIRIKNEEKF